MPILISYWHWCVCVCVQTLQRVTPILLRTAIAACWAEILLFCPIVYGNYVDNKAHEQHACNKQRKTMCSVVYVLRRVDVFMRVLNGWRFAVAEKCHASLSGLDKVLLK